MNALDAELMPKFAAPPQLPAAALAWADLISSPTGQPGDPERRLAEILDRCPRGSLVHETTQASLPYARVGATHRGLAP